MAALISWTCTAGHGVRDRGHPPSVTVHEGKWAYCLVGADREHTWVAIDPVRCEMLPANWRSSEVRAAEEVRTR